MIPEFNVNSGIINWSSQKIQKTITKSSQLTRKKHPKFLHFYIGLYLDYIGCVLIRKKTRTEMKLLAGSFTNLN